MQPTTTIILLAGTKEIGDRGSCFTLPPQAIKAPGSKAKCRNPPGIFRMCRALGSAVDSPRRFLQFGRRIDGNNGC